MVKWICDRCGAEIPTWEKNAILQMYENPSVNTNVRIVHLCERCRMELESLNRRFFAREI